MNVLYENLSKEELNKLLASATKELQKRRLVVIRKTLSSVDVILGEYTRVKVDMAQQMLEVEYHTTKRQVYIEQYLEELEILLNID